MFKQLPHWTKINFFFHFTHSMKCVLFLASIICFKKSKMFINLLPKNIEHFLNVCIIFFL